MTYLTFIRYFVPDSDEFAPGWYQTRNEGRTRIGDVPLSLSDALYDGPNRVIIDDNTPETNTLPVSGGKGVDEFLITLTANSVVIDDDSEANVIVFERDVVITSIERPAGSEGASVAQYVITLSSGKTITLRNPASFTFQHLGDAARTDPISAEDFVAAYEDGFAASDTSHPDIIGDASGPSGVQGPMIISEPPTASRTEDDVDPVTGMLFSGGLPLRLLTNTDPPEVAISGSVEGTYGTMTLSSSVNQGDGTTNWVWTYTLDNAVDNERGLATQALGEGDTGDDVFTFRTQDGFAVLDVTITVNGANDAPEVATAIESQSGMEGQEKVIDLSTLFSDIDANDTLTLSVSAELDGNEITFDGSRNIISDLSASKMLAITLASPGTYTVTVMADDGNGGTVSSSFSLEVEADTPPVIGIPGSADRAGAGAVTEDGTLTATGMLEVTDADSPPTLPAIELDGNGVGTYGTMTFDESSGEWTYTLAVTPEQGGETQALTEGQIETETFTFRAGVARFEVTITVTGANDDPVVATAIETQSGVEGLEKVIDLSTLFTDIDANDTLTLSVVVELAGTEIVFDGSRNIISDPNASKMLAITLASPGTYTVTVMADDGNGGTVSSSFSLEVEADTPPVIGIPGSADRAGEGAVTEDGTLTATGVLEVTDADNPPTLPTIELDGDGVGTYGTMTFDGSSWTYTLAVTPEQGGKTQALTEGQIETETFTFSAGVATFEVTITVTGTNDAPVVGTAITNKTGTINLPIAEINLGDAFTDADENDTLTLTLTVTLDGNAVILTTNGPTTTLGDTGLTYNTETHILSGSPSAVGTYKIKIVADDSAGASSAETEFDIVIVHQTISGDETGSVTEGGAPGDDNTGELTAPGSTITLTPKEGTDSPGMSTGTYGVMAFDGTTWTYTLDDRAEALADGQTATESFTFSTGGEAFVVTITVTGVNDAPVVGTAITNKTGTINQPIAEINLGDAFTDADENDTLTLALTVTFDGTDDNTDNGIEVALTPNGSTITLGDTGLTYNTETNILSGNPRAAGTYKIKIVATDSAGASSAETEFDIVIAPQTISGDETGSVTEGGAPGDDNTGTLTAVGSTITLVSKETTDSPGMSTGTYGVMAFNASSGEWTYTLDNTDADTNALKDTPGTDVFTFTATGTSFDVTITISGVNDVPVVESEIVGQTGRVGQAITAIDLSGLFTDVDTGDTFTLTVMVLSSDGSKSGLDTIGLEYDSDTKMITGTLLNSIVAGPYTIEVIATDGGGSGAASQPSTFNIVVAADNAPVIGGAVDGTIAEDAADPITGTLTITDADNDALPTVELSSGAGQYGTLTFAASADGGVWTYRLDNSNAAVQALKGDTLTDDFTFIAEGADPITVTITISGVNDAPVVETEIVGQTGRVGQEIKAIDLSGLFTDVDTGDTFTLTVMVLSSDGSTKSGLDTLGLEYDSDTKMITGTLLNSVVAGPYTIEVIATDGGGSGAASQPSTFDIVVAPDNAPVIGGAVDGTIAEDAADPLTGTLTITDADDDALPTVVLSSGAGQYGTLTFVASADGGVWTYTLDNTNAAVQALKGDTLTEEFTFTAEGADPITVTITISGVNDVPVVESEIVGKSGRVGQEITAIDLSGLFTDVDTGDTFTLTVMVLSSDGNTRMALGTTLGLEYDSDTKMITGTLLDSIPTGPYTIEVIATDGSGAASQPSTFDIVVVADGAPVIGGAVDGMIAEDAAGPITGTLTITDAEGDAVPTVALTDGAGQYGTLTFVASADGGVWTYTLDNTNAAVQALKGDTLEDNFTFTAEGAAPITVTITISGVNDAPVVATAIESQSGVDGQEKVIDLSTLFTDVDEGDELTFAVTLDDDRPLSTIGLTYNSDDDEITGTLTGTGTYVIKIVATDQSGATVEATFDLNIFIIQLNSLTYNPDETSITIDETMLKVTSDNQSDPTLLVYTITTLPDAGMLSKSGTPLNSGDTFTQADINDGLITYVPDVSDPSTSQSNPLSFTISDGVATLEEQTLQITSREVFEDADADADEDNTIDQSSETTPQKIEAGDGSDIITGGTSDDQIDGGAGDDEIKLTRTVGGVEEDAGRR